MISVIVTTYDWDRFDYLVKAVDSVPDEFEVVGAFEDPDMAEAFETITGQETVFDPSIDGLSAARNAGAQKATGSIYAFIDDDVLLADTWPEAIKQTFDDDAVAAGGPAVPIWPSYRPWFVPKLWDWLIGCGPYYDEIVEVRNTYGCNISFRADVFDELGGFDPDFGKSGDLGQAEETELCQRMNDVYDEAVVYNPDMVVKHHVFEEQLNMLHLITRAHEQGRVKARMGLDSDESSFLTEAIRSLIPPNMSESIASSLYLAATGIGFLREKLTSRIVYPFREDITH